MTDCAIRNAVAALTAFLLLGCVDATPSSHEGLNVGMTKEAAFEVTCERMRRGELRPSPVLYKNHIRRRSIPDELICDIREEAMAAEQWEIIELGWRERFIVLDFEEGRLVRIETMWRGWDP